MVKRLSTLVVVAVGGGCVDARGAYDDYAKRVVDAAPKPDADPNNCPSQGVAHDINGTFLFGGIAKPGQPKDIAFRVTIVQTPGTGGRSTADLSMLPLKVSDSTPAGDPLTADDVAIDECGNYTFQLRGFFPGAANPLSTTISLDLDVTFTGGVYSPDFICGTLDGIGLIGGSGSTDLEGPYAMQRLANDTDPLPPSKNDCADGGF